MTGADRGGRAPPAETERRLIDGATSGDDAPRVLIVDDDATQRLLLRSFLESRNFLVDEAASAPECLAMLKRRPAQLVISDILMPGMNGVEMLARIRERWESSDLPVIMVTGRDDPQHIVHALRSGANDYITKPFEFDVTEARIRTQLELVRSRAAVKSSEERYALVIAATNDGIWDWDLRAGRIFFSRRWKELIGFADSDVCDRPDAWFERIHADDRGAVLAAIERLVEGNAARLECEYRMRHRDRGYRWMRTRGTALRDRSGRAVRLAGIQTDVTERKLVEPITGLPNRVLFLDRVNGAIAAHRVDAQALFSVVLIRVEGWEAIKQSYGQRFCDDIQADIAQRLSRLVRPRDTLACVGENSFGLLVQAAWEADELVELLGRMRRAANRPIAVNDEEVRPKLIVGVAHGDHGYRAGEDLVHAATIALNAAEQADGDGVTIYDAGMRVRALNRIKLETDLRSALERDELLLHFQPIFALADRRPREMESLLRWHSLRRGTVAPGEFIPVAERTGEIIPIGFWVLEQAARHALAWRRARLFPAPPTVAVNVSPRQFASPGFADRVKAILAETGIEPACVTLEITETAVMDDQERSIRIIDSLRRDGVRFAIDDFGTGYSSLSTLHRLPIDAVKVDRAFVTGLDADPLKRSMVEMVVTLGHGFGFAVVAEGIERKEEADVLSQIGCDFGQGYYLARPMPAGDVPAFARRVERRAPAG